MPRYNCILLRVNSQTVHTYPLTICRLQFRFSCPSAGPHDALPCLCFSKQWCHRLISVSLSSLSGSSMPCVLPSLTGIQAELLAFQPVCLSYFLLGLLGNFQAPHMPIRSWNSEVCLFHISSHSLPQTTFCLLSSTISFPRPPDGSWINLAIFFVYFLIH